MLFIHLIIALFRQGLKAVSLNAFPSLLKSKSESLMPFEWHRFIHPDVKVRLWVNPYGISRVAAGEAKDLGELKIFPSSLKSGLCIILF
jgi:hypothetical protein